MALSRYLVFILAVSVVVGLVAKYVILFLRKAKKTEERIYNRLEKKMLPQSKVKVVKNHKKKK